MRPIGIALLLAACSGKGDDPTPPADADTDADADADADTDTDTDADSEHGMVWNETVPEGTHTVVAALHSTDLLHFSFAEQARVDVTGPWDIAFARYTVTVNGGISGDADVTVTRVEAGDFEALGQAPAGPWITDLADTNDDGLDDLAFINWYDYDPKTHRLSPHDRLYVVDSSAGPVAMAFTGYYREEDDASGYVGFLWKPLDPPSARLTHTFDGDDVFATVVAATSDVAFTTLDLRHRTDPAPADPSTDTSWDLAFRRTEILLNGGSSGPGAAEAVWLDGDTLDDVVTAPTSGFARDAKGAPVLGAWFDDVGGVITPKVGTFVVRSGRGTWALQLTGYDAGTVELRWKELLD